MISALLVQLFALLFVGLVGIAFFFLWLNFRHREDIERSYSSFYRPEDFIDAVVKVSTKIGVKTLELTKKLSKEFFSDKQKREIETVS